MTGTPLDFNEIEEIKILRANGLTFHAISLKMGRDPKTVKKACLDPMIASEIIEIKEVLADQYENLARRMIDSIRDEDIQKINAYQRTIASGICTDKMRLLRNETTENFSINALHDDMDDNAERIIELKRRISEMTGVDPDVEQAKRLEERKKKRLALEDKTHNQIQNDEN